MLTFNFVEPPPATTPLERILPHMHISAIGMALTVTAVNMQGMAVLYAHYSTCRELTWLDLLCVADTTGLMQSMID